MGSIRERQRGATLCGAGILGRSLWDCIDDANTRTLYQQLFARVRTGRSITIPFRCDSSTIRRDMHLQMQPMANGSIACATISDSEVLFEALPVLLVATGDTTPTVVTCSWCRRVRVGQMWVDLEEAVAALQIFARRVVNDLSHGICAQCEAEVTSSLR